MAACCTICSIVSDFAEAGDALKAGDSLISDGVLESGCPPSWAALGVGGVFVSLIGFR